MTTYNVYFTNNYSDVGTNQDYAFFCELPAISGVTASTKAYSNIFMTKTCMRGSNWSIDVTKNFYAWCGKAPVQLAPDVKVSEGMGQLATLGTASAPGSTFSMINNGSGPAFTSDVTLTANPGSYEIDTGIDFTSNLNYLIGLGGTDYAGRMKPLATIAAPRNAKVNIAPVTKFYIAAYSASVGTTIITSAVSKDAGVIDFTANPGMFSAIVSQEPNGAFTVSYQTQAAFAMTLATAQAASLGPNAQLRQLKHQVHLLSQLLATALGEPASPNDASIPYRCVIDWHGAPSPANKNDIIAQLVDSMVHQGYTSSHSTQSATDFMVTMAKNVNAHVANEDWLDAMGGLPGGLVGFVTNARTYAPALEGPETKTVAAPVAVNGVGSGGGESESMEAKKQRAMELLRAEGLAEYA